MTIHVDTLNNEVIFNRTPDLSDDLGELLRDYIIPFADRQESALRMELEERKKESEVLKTEALAFIAKIRQDLREAIKEKRDFIDVVLPESEYRGFLRKLSLYEKEFYTTDGSQNTNPLFSDLEEFGKNCCRVNVAVTPDGWKIKWVFEYSTAYYLLRKRAS